MKIRWRESEWAWSKCEQICVWQFARANDVHFRWIRCGGFPFIAFQSGCFFYLFLANSSAQQFDGDFHDELELPIALNVLNQKWSLSQSNVLIHSARVISMKSLTLMYFVRLPNKFTQRHNHGTECGTEKKVSFFGRKNVSRQFALDFNRIECGRKITK